jgi:hypothetical protein
MTTSDVWFSRWDVSTQTEVLGTPPAETVTIVELAAGDAISFEGADC